MRNLKSISKFKMQIRDRSLFIAWGVGGGGAENFKGDYLIFGRTKRGSVVTENPKEGIAGALEGFTGRPFKFVWKMNAWEGGIAKA